MYWKYVLKRLFYVAMTYVIIIFIYSALFNTVMDRSVRAQIDEQVQGEMMRQNLKKMTEEEVKNFIATRKGDLAKKYHLDEPVYSRIFWRAINTLTFNYGDSTIMKSSQGEKEVWLIIKEKIPNTMLLFSVAIIFDIVLGILLGIKKAQKPNKVLDQSTSIITMIFFGLPTWWLAMVLIMFFVYTIPIFPSAGMHMVPPPDTFFANLLDLLYHLALPVLTLVIIGFWGRAYLTRNIVLGTLQEDYVMSARARGLSEKQVLYGHALRSAAPPIVTMALMALLGSVAGGLVFEGIFSWPGMGNLYWSALQQNDIPVLLGNLSVTTLLYLSGLVVLDLIYGFLDPRIKVGGKA